MLGERGAARRYRGPDEKGTERARESGALREGGQGAKRWGDRGSSRSEGSKEAAKSIAKVLRLRAESRTHTVTRRPLWM
eukprot:266293-Rhodomonas_salina.2